MATVFFISRGQRRCVNYRNRYNGSPARHRAARKRIVVRYDRHRFRQRFQNGLLHSISNRITVDSGGDKQRQKGTWSFPGPAHPHSTLKGGQGVVIPLFVLAPQRGKMALSDVLLIESIEVGHAYLGIEYPGDQAQNSGIGDEPTSPQRGFVVVIFVPLQHAGTSLASGI